MAFRTVIIDQASRINLDLNNIVVHYKNEHFWINLDEISIIIIEDPRCSVSLKLLTEICEKGITFILNNTSHMPVGSINTLYNHSRASKNIYNQVNWQRDTKLFLWTEIVKRKIKSQIVTLEKTNKTDKQDILTSYINSIDLGDVTNREGLASRVYFKELFGKNFKRFNDDMINFSLNYAYQIIRSKISQEIVALGYIPCFGIFHRSEYNHFNLADDFIEVFRPIIDYYVYHILNQNEEEYFTTNLKIELVNIINKKVLYNNMEQKIYNCIPLYLQNMFNFLEKGDISKIIFPELL
ncbi:MAG TPA: type II CRISPR-associated endonuclease Cas1 [Tenericutes bacterium]|nr:type II CRISPR-associated endonuclease Cas1 [Mycoplasmatota bacterium]